MTSSCFTQDRLSTLLGICIVPAVLELAGVDEDGVDAFYRSKLYRLLGDVETGLWHFSPRTLAEMYMQEQQTGAFDIPEGCA